MTGANMTGANMTGANMTGANMTGANMTDANMTDAPRNLVLAALALAGLILAACSTGSLWTKDGLTREELTSDSKACLKETDDYGFLDFESASYPGAGPGTESSYSSRGSLLQADLYRLCMRQRGYSYKSASPPEATPEE